MTTPSHAAIRVCLVEDNPGDADLLRERLADVPDAAYIVDHFTRLRDAEPHIRGGACDVVLLDLSLPDTSGIETVRRARENGAGEVAVVVLTEHDDERLAFRCIEAGAQDYLCKADLGPVSLRRAIGFAISRSQHLRAEDLQKRLARSDQKLGRSEDYNRALLSAIPDMIFRMNRDGVFVDFISGVNVTPYVPADAFLGRRLDKVLPTEVVEPVLVAIDTALEDGTTQSLEYHLDEGGATNWYEARVTRCADDEVVVIVRDQSEQRKTQQQLRQAQKMEAIGRLAGGVAHDFNNLLTGILSFGSFIAETLRPEDPAYQDMQEILAGARRAEDLTRQLLAFSRTQTVAPRVLSVNSLVENIDRMLRRIVGEDIDIQTALAEKVWNIRIDPGAFEQVLVNLVVNARDAMPSGGKLTLETQNVELDAEYAVSHGAEIPTGEYVALIVSDSGVGMDRDTQMRVFEPFFTTKDAAKGTGLGLSTCYGIVKQADGFIWVYSEVGKGTAIKVYFPRVAAEVDKLGPKKSTRPTRGTETVLVVEDEPQVRALVARVLKKQGYTVLVAESGGDALLLCERHEGTIDLLLTDVVMPNMSGKELADRLALVRPGLKALYMSGYTPNASVHQGILAGTITMLQKPFTPPILAAKVREVLDGDV